MSGEAAMNIGSYSILAAPKSLHAVAAYRLGCGALHAVAAYRLGCGAAADVRNDDQEQCG